MLKQSTKNSGRNIRRILLGTLGTAVAVLFVLVNTVRAQSPSTQVNFQARLLQASGALVADGYYNVQFKLYNVSSGGSALWTESYYDSNGVSAGNDNRVRVVNGYLTVNLGSQTAFSGINWDQELWLGMNVGGTTQTATPTYDGEMSPRLKLTAVPFAYRAGGLAAQSGSFRTTVDITAPTANRTITLPDATGTALLGTSNLNTNGVLYGTGNATVLSTAAGTTGQCLIATTSAAPSWGTCAGTGTTYFTVQGTSGTPQSINGGDTLTVAAGSNITTTASATDTLTVAVVNNPIFSGLVTGQAGLYSVGSGLDLVTLNGTGTGNTVLRFQDDGAETAAIYTLNGETNLRLRAGTGGNLYFQANGSTSVSATLFNNGNFGIGDTSPAALFTVGSGDLFQVNSSGAIAAVTGITTTGGYTQSGTSANTFTGAMTINVANAGAFDVQNGSSQSVLKVSTNSTVPQVIIGAGTPDVALTLDSFGTEPSSGTANGMMYYNSTTNKFRCYEGGRWVNCTSGFLERDTFGMRPASIGNDGTYTNIVDGWGVKTTSYTWSGAGVYKVTSEADGMYTQLTTGNTAAWQAYANATAFVTARRHNPVCTIKVRTGGTATNARMWVGLFAADTYGSGRPPQADTAGMNAIGVRYSQPAGDTGWVGITNNGSSQSATSSLSTYTTAKSYSIRIRVDDANGRVYFRVDNVTDGTIGTETSLTTNLPASSQGLSIGYSVENVTGTLFDIFNIGRFSCEHDTTTML